MKRSLIALSVLLNIALVIFSIWIVNLLGSFLNGLPTRVNDQYNLLSNHTAEVVFLGDSITFGGIWHEWFPNVDVVNRGIGGDTTQMVLDRFEQVISLKPKKLFIMIGVNDLNKGLGSEVAVANYDVLFNIIDVKLPDTNIYIQSVLPVNDDWNFTDNADIPILNASLKKHAAKRGYTYIDLHSKFSDSNGLLIQDLSSDGIHLLGKGYALWHNEIFDFIHN
jgi:lysophospholipase L1-like esterase